MKIQRTRYFNQLEYLVQNSPVTALLGPRQCGKTTLAKDFGNIQKSHYFDLESTVDSVALQNPKTVLSELDGLIILDKFNRCQIYSMCYVSWLTGLKENAGS